MSFKLNRTTGCITKLLKVVLFVEMIILKIIVYDFNFVRTFCAKMSPAEELFGNSVRGLNKEEIFGNNFFTKIRHHRYRNC